MVVRKLESGQQEVVVSDQAQEVDRSGEDV